MVNFKFLVTTDNHMGYKHDDKLRRKDSFMAFAETLQIARERDVDFVLLGGDLFHTNKPSVAIEHKCIKILRQHMAAKSTRPTTFRRVSGEFSHFARVKHGNFEDASLSVPCPIFTIHGNHDDPTGPSAKSICEKLATCGLLNYFGKVKQFTNDKDINIEPIVLEKDSIKISLYGIGFIPDKKLCSAFKLNHVNFKKPQPDTFNVLVVHQNRLMYDKEKYIPDSVFPKWFHLIIRGHEHDAQMPEVIPESNVSGLVYQPGSTVATSIEMRESTAKQCGLMTVELRDGSGDEKDRYKLNYEIIDLKCYRRIIFKDVYQKEVFDHIKETDGRKKLTPIEYRNIFRKFVIDKIDSLLEKTSQELTGSQENANGNSSPSSEESATQINNVYKKLYRFKLPLLRVRLEFVNKSEVFDDTEINAIFHPNQVANRDIIKFRKQRLVKHPDGSRVNVTFEDDESSAGLEGVEDELAEVEAIDLTEERKDTIDGMIANYFREKPEKDRLTAISLDEYTDAVDKSEGGGNIIAKVLAMKRNAVMLKYKAALKDDDTAKLYFTDESKIRDWFVSTLKGETPKLVPNNKDKLDEDWDEDEMDDDDDVIVL